MCLGKKKAYTVLGQKNQISFILQQEEERPRKAADLERVTCINQYNYMETWTATALESECSLSCIPREVAWRLPRTGALHWEHFQNAGMKQGYRHTDQIHLPAPADYQVVPLCPSVYKIHLTANQAAGSCCWVWDFCPGVLHRAMARCGTCCPAGVFPCALVQMLRALFHWAVDGENASNHRVIVWAQLSGYLKL